MVCVTVAAGLVGDAVAELGFQALVDLLGDLPDLHAAADEDALLDLLVLGRTELDHLLVISGRGDIGQVVAGDLDRGLAGQQSRLTDV